MQPTGALCKCDWTLLLQLSAAISFSHSVTNNNQQQNKQGTLIDILRSGFGQTE